MRFIQLEKAAATNVSQTNANGVNEKYNIHTDYLFCLPQW